MTKNERDWIQVFEKGNKTKEITIIIAMGMDLLNSILGPSRTSRRYACPN